MLRSWWRPKGRTAPLTGRNSSIRRLLWIMSACVLGMIPGAALAKAPRPGWHPGPPWAPLAPHSGEVNEISNLFWIMLILSGLIFIGVCGVLIYNIVHFSGKEGDPEPNQVFGNRTVEMIWTIIPTLILLVAFGATVKAIHDINNSSSGGKILQIRAIGHQWWWEFQYPSLGVETANEVHVPAGMRIHFHVESKDVIHSFWIPQLARQVDANPGQDNAIFTTMDTPGVYGGMCYEYCGTSHAWMKFRTVVQTPSQFAAWAKHESAPAHTSASAPSSVTAGRKAFLAHTCIECHAIQGTNAGGVVGPNLTHFASRWTIGAGAAPVTKADLIQWIRNPQTYKAGVYMPPYPFLSHKQVSDMADYLLSLK